MRKEWDIVTEIMNQGELIHDFVFSENIYNAGLNNDLSEYLVERGVNIYCL